MDPIWFVVVAGFAIWWMVVYTLDKAGVLKRFNITAYGPLIMWRTYRGQGLLNALASPKTFWKALFSLTVPFVFVCMLTMLGMIVVAVVGTIIKTPPPSELYAPQNILAIPGVNQFIPFLWGWIALVVAMVVHEFGHAIMARAEDIKVKSLGLLLVPVPVGAFAEIDEEEMFGTKSGGGASEILGPLDTKAAGEGARKASSMAQVRILSAGVVSNFLIAVIAFALLFGPVLGAIGATNSEMVVVNVAPGTPAGDVGIQKNLIISAVDGVNVSTPDQFNSYLKAHEGSDVTVSGLQGDRPASYTVHVGDSRGIYILGTIEGYPAQAAGIGKGTHITSIDGTPIDTVSDYSRIMANTTPGQTIAIGAIAPNGTALSYHITLTSGTEPKGYLGFNGADMSDNSIGIVVGGFDGQEHLTWLKNLLVPTGDTLADQATSFVSGVFVLWILPVWETLGGLIGFGIFQSDLSGLFHPVGWAAPLGNGIFYIALSLFWIGWLNMNIGLFNCLPMIPLDGGHIFREVVRVFVGAFVKDSKQVDRISGAIVNGFAITLLSSLVFMIVAPYIVHSLV